MKRISLFCLLCMNMFIVRGQVTADFENIFLPPQGYENNASPETGFTSSHCFLPNYFDAQFNYWEGWAISAITDNQTPGFQNQYSAIPGEGALGSAQYAMAYASPGVQLKLEGSSKGKPVQGLYVTNSTYAYYTIRDGDAFSKRFGGETGNDPDYFLLTIWAWHNGFPTQDSVNVYLADYRFSDNSQDYILDEWVWVDLTGLGAADSLSFFLRSTDVGSFGMNTPAYFCLDHVQTTGEPSSLISSPKVYALNIWPNPSSQVLHVTTPASAKHAFIRDIHGRVVQSVPCSDGTTTINVHYLPPGLYTLAIYGAEGWNVSTWTKMP